VSQGWENVAGEWIAFVLSEDAPFEWHGEAFLELVADERGELLDAGCGEGRLSRRLAKAGFAVVGVDAAPALLRSAREQDPDGDYRVADVTSLPFADASFDVVASFMVLQDVSDHETAIREAARVLRPGGAFCVAIVHPLTSAGDWASDDPKADYVVENYCGTFARERPLGARTITQYHRPVADYLSAVAAGGLRLEELRELGTRRRSPGRIPIFLDLRARKI
jgi:2-polyprenyl-3-methyl-5-hydroxy-6-metoxy-1,4-benzoquinol methylase